ncbi:quercetin 2,3-dioxygenase [Aspergillus karnatakaensis]|uniref:quercetin 2,3-dioxygenase n=1 Tax=Aspergillus karnatakaensis TaxID=1810916 RepID=UPI003CCD1C0C
MKVNTLLLAAAAGTPAALAAPSKPTSLFVENAPDHLRPYIIRSYANAQAVNVQAQTYRFMVTGPSSDNAFTLMDTNAPHSNALGVLPHHHARHYENFYNSKGRFQLWAQKDNDTQQTRVLYPGDYGSVVPNTTHTFQILDPDTQLTGTIFPGGFEDLFFFLGTNYTASTHTPYIPQVDNSTDAAGPPAELISTLETFDVYAELDFEHRTDIETNGAAPEESVWHDGDNELGAPKKPYFIANGWGPKSLNSQTGYHIVAPLVSPQQSGSLNFTLSTISISQTPKNVTVPTWRFEGACAFKVLEGQLSVQIANYPVAQLIGGDVAFVPAGVPVKYWSEAYFTRFLFPSAGVNGLDQQLIRRGREYEFVTFPSTWA